MKSPFPGMDPYLQRHWFDVRASLVVYSSEQLNRQMPPELVARMNERVYLEKDPDPARVRFPDEPCTETFIEILDRTSKYRVITAIEFIGPNNKTPGNGFKLYRSKQNEREETGVNSVEIDLTGGYQVVIRRGGQWHQAEVRPLPLREHLPTILIPLRTGDADAHLDLQILIERAYYHGRYEITDYKKTLTRRWKAMMPSGPTLCCGMRGNENDRPAPTRLSRHHLPSR